MTTIATSNVLMPPVHSHSGHQQPRRRVKRELYDDNNDVPKRWGAALGSEMPLPLEPVQQQQSVGNSRRKRSTSSQHKHKHGLPKLHCVLAPSGAVLPMPVLLRQPALAVLVLSLALLPSCRTSSAASAATAMAAAAGTRLREQVRLEVTNWKSE